MPRKGEHQSEEAKQKIRLALLNKVRTDEHRKNISLSKMGKPSWNKGIPMLEKTKSKLSDAAKKRYEENPELLKQIGDFHRGMRHSEETKAQMSASHKKRYEDPEERKKTGDYIRGVPRSEETKKKISESHKKLDPPSKETRLKISVSNTGKTRSEEFKRKVSLTKKGRPHSPEHNKHIGDANRGKKGRSPSAETRLKLSVAHQGDKCHFWKGGKSFEPYCVKFSRELKERVRAFYNYTCVLCGIPQGNKKHNVHHTNYDKMVCCNDEKPLFVSLCDSCHAKTNHNREYWQQHFTDMINNYYGGKCYFTKEEMISFLKKSL